MPATGLPPTTEVALQIPAPNWCFLPFCPVLTSGMHLEHKEGGSGLTARLWIVSAVELWRVDGRTWQAAGTCMMASPGGVSAFCVRLLVLSEVCPACLAQTGSLSWAPKRPTKRRGWKPGPDSPAIAQMLSCCSLQEAKAELPLPKQVWHLGLWCTQVSPGWDWRGSAVQ